jgi:hypothetical protein
MKSLNQFVNESAISKEEAREDYGHVDGCDSKKDKQVFAEKYGCESLKKGDIQHAILLKLREIRKSSKSFDKEDYTDFMRLNDWTILKIADYLKEESSAFVNWLVEFYKEEILGKKLQNWIGQNPNGAYMLSYADKDKIKRYNKIIEYAASITPKTRTAKDDIFDMLVNKFTELLKDYKEEYLKKVAAAAKQRYNIFIPETISFNKDLRKKLTAEIDKLDWRTHEWSKKMDERRKLDNKIERLSKILSKYTEKTYTEYCVEEATREFEANIKELAFRIQKDELDVEKLVVKSVHDDPKVFKMKITDGQKNLFCRSIIAALNSEYMIPHYRFIITNRSKDDSAYDD